MKEYEVIKKNYGEKFARFCRSNFSTILDNQGVLSEILEKKFSPNKFLYEDLVENDLETVFISYIYNLSNLELPPLKKVEGSPEELLKRVGYTLYKCETRDDVLKFKKYYKETEELCTFKDVERINTHIIFFAVKDNVDEIKRENFENPTRQDEYGTSVISIQFRKKDNDLSIKNRYNHAVENPDATFSNNLENILPGLTNSFAEHYNINVRYEKVKQFVIPGYIVARDGKQYKTNVRIGDIYYCPNNIIIDCRAGIGKVQQLNKDKYEVIDQFIIDKEEKKFAYNHNDSLKDVIGKIKNIEVTKNQDGNKIIQITNEQGEITKLTVNKANQLIGFENNDIENVPDHFLESCYHLQKFEANNLKTMGSSCLSLAEEIKTLSLPNLEKMGSRSCRFLINLKELYAPKLKMLEGSNFYHTSLKELNLPAIEEMCNFCFTICENLEKVNLENIEKMAKECFYYADELTILNAPKLIRIGASSFYENKIKDLYLPSLKSIEAECFMHSNKLESVNLPNLIDMLTNSFRYVENLKILNAEKLTFMDTFCFSYANSLREANLNSLEMMLQSCFLHVNSLTELNLNSLKYMGENCFMENNLKVLNVPETIHLTSNLAHFNNNTF